MKEQYSDFLKLLFLLTKEKKNFKLSGNDIEVIYTVFIKR